MPTQQLIYESVIPVSKERHANWSVDVAQGHGYSKNLQFVPVLGAELIAVSREYPIVFSQTENGFQPLALLGMRKEENLYISESNEWSARYIPAFLRRYPFVFARSENSRTFTLCLDEEYTGFNEERLGQPLFTKDKEPTPYLSNMLEFLKKFESEQARSQAFCRKLDEFDLYESHNAVWTGPDGEKAAVTGFFCLSRSKLNDLPPKVLAGMAKRGELDLVYAHLFSLENFKILKERLAAVQKSSD